MGEAFKVPHHPATATPCHLPQSPVRRLTNAKTSIEIPPSTPHNGLAMEISELGASAILTIERFMEANGEKPSVLYFGPEEYRQLVAQFGAEDLNFYGVPVRPMTTPGVMARSAPSDS